MFFRHKSLKPEVAGTHKSMAKEEKKKRSLKVCLDLTAEEEQRRKKKRNQRKLEGERKTKLTGPEARMHTIAYLIRQLQNNTCDNEPCDNVAYGNQTVLFPVAWKWTRTYHTDPRPGRYEH
jgi:hypothetical protein